MTHAAATPDARCRAAEAFRAAFGNEPQFIATAPGRVNLIGEHIDYSGGHVLPFAIDRVCAVAASPGSGRARVLAVDLGETWTAPPLARLAEARDRTEIRPGSWQAYIAGVMHFVGGALGEVPGVDLAIATDVPIGAGLSSSAAIEVAVATALEAASGRSLDPLRKARLCQQAEHEFAGVPCGIMDQAAAVLGRANHAVLLDCRDIARYRHVALPSPDQAALYLFESGVKHALGQSEYPRRRAASESAAARIGVPWLSDAESHQVSAAHSRLTDEERRCADHATGENRRVMDCAQALQAADFQSVGRALLASHASLRDVYRVSCPELDVLVDAAAAQPGVYGARMTGGGFGGCVIALIMPDAVGVVTGRVQAAFAARFGRPCTSMAVRAAGGAAVCATPPSSRRAS